MAINPVNIIPDNTNVTVITDDKKIVISGDVVANNVNVTQPIVNTIRVEVPGPQGSKGDKGDKGDTPSTTSFVQTGSFNQFTSSYYTDSSSFESRIGDLEIFSSSLDNTFATDVELNQATASLSASISLLSSSFESFSGSYNTGSFSGSFSGDGSGLTNVPASSVVGLNLTRISTVNVTASVSEGTDTFKIVSGSKTPFVISNDGIISGTGSLLIDLNARETNIQTTLISNQNVGGISSGESFVAGTDVEDILRQILIQYIPPSFGSLTMKNGGTSITFSTKDAGDSFTINTASFSATTDDPDGIYPISSSFTASNADGGDITYYFGDDVIGATNNLEIGNNYTINVSNPSTSGTTVTFRVRGKRSDTNSFITDTTDTVSFRWRNYLAASSTVISDDATAQSVIGSDVVQSTLDTNREWIATCNFNNDNSSNYTYIIYPSGYGDLSQIIQDGATPVLTAFTKLGDFTISNSYASSRLFRVYKSNSTKAFAAGTTLNIT